MKGLAVGLAVLLAASATLVMLQPMPGASGAGPQASAAGEPAGMPASDAAGAALDHVRFEPNMGQAAPGALFTGFVREGAMLLERDAITLVPSDGQAVRLAMPGAQASAVAGEGLQASVSHHYIGSDASSWHTGVPHYDAVRYTSIAPGVDLLVYSKNGMLEFDHIVAPGADPAGITMRVQGAQASLVGGALRLATTDSSFELAAPVAYQDILGRRVPVAAAFTLDGDTVGYAVGPHDNTRPLVIDPVIKYSSYLGGSGSDYGYAIKVGPHANPDMRTIVIGGYQSSTASAPLGFTATVQHGAGSAQAWVAKMERHLATGVVTPVWFAFIGGSGTEYGYDAALAPNGNIALGGYTSSTDFPTLNGLVLGAYDGNVDQGGSDAYGVVLDAAGNLLFSTYLGGSGTDYGYGVNFSPGGQLLVTGYTYLGTAGVDFPVINGPQMTRAYLSNDGFATKIDWSVTPATAVFSTLIGGAASDYAYAIAEDASGVTFAGYTVNATYPSPFPVTPGAYQIVPAGGGNGGWVAKLPGAGGPAWTYSTLMDFAGSDFIYDLALDGAGNAWITGRTSSSNFATTSNAFDSTLSSTYDAFIAAISADGASLVYASLIGGTSSNDYGYGVSVAPNGDILATGRTGSSSGFPLKDAVQTTHGGSTYDSYVTRITPGGALAFSTYLGGSLSDEGRDVAADDLGNLYATGYTGSTNFPTLNAVQPAMVSQDAFMAIIGRQAPTAQITADAGVLGSATAPPPATLTVPVNTPVAFTALGSTKGEDDIDWSATTWQVRDGAVVVDTGSGGPAPLFVGSGTDLQASANAVVYTVCVTVWDVAGLAYDSSDTACIDVEWVHLPPTALFAAPPEAPIGAPVAFTDLSTDDVGIASWSWTFGDTTTSTQQHPSHAYASPGTYTVRLTVTDTAGLSDTYTQDILIIRGPVAVCKAASSPLAGTPVDLLDLSMSGDHAITSWLWDFGDASGTSTESNPSHVYDLPGTYDVSLTVGDGTYTHTGMCYVDVVDSTPQPRPDSYTVVRGDTLTVPAPGVLGNDNDPSTLGLSAGLVTDVAHGTLALAADGGFTYTPDDGFVGLDPFTYNAIGLITAGPVPVTITVTEFPPPVADFTWSLSGQEASFLDLSQPGHGAITTWEWDFGNALSGERNPTRVLGGGHRTVTLSVWNEHGLFDTKSVTIFVPAAGQELAEPTGPPVADAGEDRHAMAGDTVMLSGTATGQSRGRTMHYEWVQVGGPPVALLNDRTAYPSFVAPHVMRGQQVVLSFALVVHNGIEFSEADVVHVSIGHVNRAPTAVAATLLSMDEGGQLVLDATGSMDPDGDDLLFTWSAQTGRVQATGPMATFTGAVGTHLLLLEVSDGAAYDELLIEVRVRPLVDAPTAFFDAIVRGQEVIFVDKSIGGAAYAWDFGDGTTSHERHPTREFPAGTHTIRLTVKDADGDEDVMERVVLVREAPAAPPPTILPGEEPMSAPPAGLPLLPGILAAVGIALVAVLLAVAVIRRR